MRIPNIIIGAALTAAFVIGCSKHQSQPSSLPSTTKDLGVVELTPQTPQQFSLDDRKVCTLVGKQVANGILEVSLVILSTNADGNIERYQNNLVTKPGQQSSISTGDTMVSLTPSLKYHDDA